MTSVDAELFAGISRTIRATNALDRSNDPLSLVTPRSLSHLISPYLAVVFVKSASSLVSDDHSELDSILASIALSLAGIAFPVFVSRAVSVSPRLLVQRYRQQVELTLAEHYSALKPSSTTDSTYFMVEWVKAVIARFGDSPDGRPLFAQLNPNWVVVLKSDQVSRPPADLQRRVNAIKGAGFFGPGPTTDHLRQVARRMLAYDASALYEAALRGSSDSTFTHIHVPDSLDEAIRELTCLDDREVAVAALATATIASLLEETAISCDDVATFLQHLPLTIGRHIVRSGDNETLSALRRVIRRRLDTSSHFSPDLTLDSDKESGTEADRTLSDWVDAELDSPEVIRSLSAIAERLPHKARMVALARDAEYLLDSLSSLGGTWAHVSRANTGQLYGRFLLPLKRRACQLDCAGAFAGHEEVVTWCEHELNQLFGTEPVFRAYTNRTSALLADFLRRSCDDHSPIFVDIGYWGTFPIYLVWVCQQRIGIRADLVMVESYCSGPPDTFHETASVAQWKRSTINQLGLPGKALSRTQRYTDLPSAVASIPLLPFFSYVRVPDA